MLNGIIQVTGEMGVGKTSFALGRPGVKPSEIAVFNFDVKPYPSFGAKNRGYAHYGSYLHILQDITHPKPEHALVQAVLEDFKKLTGVKVVIFDSWEIFSKSWTTYFLERAGKYKQVIGGGQFAVMSKLGHAPKVEVSMLDELMTKFGVETIFIINHLQDEYDSPDGGEKGVKTGRKVPEASKRLEQKATMRVWLKHNPDHTCPIGVVLKDPGIHKYEGNSIVPYRLFPDRLSPKALDDVDGKNVSLWDVIAHYTNEPTGARVLRDYEQATTDEFAMMSGSLTESQRAVWQNNQKLTLLLGENFNEELIAEIGRLKADGRSAVETFNEVKENYDVSFAKVKGTYESV